jgi:AcrR family transcriptional regulator
MNEKSSAGRRERTRAATRSQIIEAAKSLFEEKPYDDVTIDDITDRADVAKGTFYLHFRTKEHVTTAVYDDLVRPVGEEILRTFSDRLSTRELLISLFEAASAPAISNPRLAQVSLSEGMSQMYTDPQPDDDDVFRNIIIKIVAQGRQSGELRLDWTIPELSVIIGTVFATALWMWFVHPSDDSLSDRIQRSVATCLEGITAR